MATPHIAIVGAGHAGVEAAFALAKGGAKVTLFSNEPGLPYFRPRLIAVAFGQAEHDAIAIKPQKAYDEAGIALLHEPAAAVDLAARTVNGRAFDGLILATGSHAFVPPFEGRTDRLHTLWTLADALKLREACTPGKTIAIIGGGVLGLEAALRAHEAGLRVAVVEAAPGLASGSLGGGEATLRRAIEEKGIALHVGTGVKEILATGVRLADGREVGGDVLLCSAGARPNGIPGHRDYLGVCGDLNVMPFPNVYAIGDIALAGRSAHARPYTPCRSVRRAQLMGRLLGESLLAAYAGKGTYVWHEPILPQLMKVGDVELHTLGDLRSPDLEERRVDDGSDPRVWKSVLWRGDLPVGLRWVGTRAGFADWEKRVCEALADACP